VDDEDEEESKGKVEEDIKIIPTESELNALIDSILLKENH
jgi:hypothetical protein